ncbi:condensation domain-containing protein, partial [Mycobacterium intermedium]|uniref:condensation domain-containing protein n=1 Tax=Mycobacterium intermedium TaxID=28445 RepID=UPI000ABFB52B
GGPGVGTLVKAAKEQLRALPPGVTYGVLRYLNEQVDLGGADPVIGFNYLGRVGRDGAASWDGWGLSPEGASKVAGAAAAIPMPLPHSVELNAATVDTHIGPRLQAEWTWAPSVFGAEQVERLNGLWFEALSGICAHVRQGGGGLSPSDIAPARLNQEQIDELCRLYPVDDILPLTPLQQGLLFHAVTTQGGDEVYAVQVSVTLSGPLDAHRLGAAVRRVVGRHPHLMARVSDQFAEPVQIIEADPTAPWHYLDLTGSDGTVDVLEQVAAVSSAERAAVGDLLGGTLFRAVLIRTYAERYRLVLTNHHFVLDGWSLPILLGEIFAAYQGQRLPASVPYRRYVNWLAGRDVDAARAAWGEVLSGIDAPTLVVSPDHVGTGRRGVERLHLSAQTTRALVDLARSSQTTLNTVLQAGFAQLLIGVTGRRDVVFGTTISTRPTELARSESMVGLLINTVPVRATAQMTTTIADLLSQLHSRYEGTLDHQHLALSEMHRLSGHDQLFDTLFVLENYPVDTATLSAEHDWEVTDFDVRESNHYPLTVQVIPGNELSLRVEFDSDVFDVTIIRRMLGWFQRVLAAMVADVSQRLSAIDVLDEAEHARLAELGRRSVLARPTDTTGSVPGLFAAQVARTPEAVALTFEGSSLSYRELDEASNRLAHLLVEAGAGPGRFVALLLP